MKKVLSILLLLFLITANVSQAHNLWLETPQNGQLGEVHTIKIYYGEYTYNYYEKVDENFTDVDDFTLWLYSPSGQKQALNVEKGGETYYQSKFTLEEEGSYKLLLVSNEIEVVDWTEYDLGILKPNFYASATVVAGAQTTHEFSSSDAPLTIEADYTNVNRGDDLPLTICFKGDMVTEQEIVVSVADQWTKTIYTNEEGKAELNLPWATQYVIEAVYTEEVTGSFKGKDYEAVRHTSTLTLKVD